MSHRKIVNSFLMISVIQSFSEYHDTPSVRHRKQENILHKFSSKENSRY